MRAGETAAYKLQLTFVGNRHPHYPPEFCNAGGNYKAQRNEADVYKEHNKDLRNIAASCVPDGGRGGKRQNRGGGIGKICGFYKGGKRK